MSSLEKFLRKDEKVLWSGKPVKIPFIVPSLIAVPFGMFFVGFSIFWMIGASKAAGSFWLFGLIFFFAGLGIVFGVPMRQLLAYRNTEYLITDQRLITQTGAIGLDTRYLDLDKIQEVFVQVNFIDKIFGTGTIFAVTAGQVYVGKGGPLMRPSLAALREPYKVQNILQEAMAKAQRPENQSEIYHALG